MGKRSSRVFGTCADEHTEKQAHHTAVWHAHVRLYTENTPDYVRPGDMASCDMRYVYGIDVADTVAVVRHYGDSSVRITLADGSHWVVDDSDLKDHYRTGCSTRWRPWDPVSDPERPAKASEPSFDRTLEQLLAQDAYNCQCSAEELLVAGSTFVRAPHADDWRCPGVDRKLSAAMATPPPAPKMHRWRHTHTGGYEVMDEDGRVFRSPDGVQWTLAQSSALPIQPAPVIRDLFEGAESGGIAVDPSPTCKYNQADPVPVLIGGGMVYGTQTGEDREMWAKSRAPCYGPAGMAPRWPSGHYYDVCEEERARVIRIAARRLPAVPYCSVCDAPTEIDATVDEENTLFFAVFRCPQKK